MFTKKTIKDIDIAGKRVLLRADYNVPIDDGKIGDDYRIKQSLLTVRTLLKQNCKLIICAHLGRPQGKPDKKYSFRPVAERLSELLKKSVAFAPDCVGDEATKMAEALKPGQVLLLENLRFHPEEEKNDPTFAKQLASLADVFVEDGFGSVHRAHASTEGVTHHLPSVSGLLLQKEVDTITNIMEDPKRPLMAIVGGAKIADKIEVMKRFIELADFVAVGGAMANTFLRAKGLRIGKSVYDHDELELARDLIDLAEKKSAKQQFVFCLPHDGVVASSLESRSKTRIVEWGDGGIAEVQAYPRHPGPKAHSVGADEMILDIGPGSAMFIAGAMQMCRTVIWNGTLGVTEVAPLQGTAIGPFAHGTETIIDALTGQTGNRPFSLVGGGDTAGYIQQRDLVDAFNHVSTGGGASLELMAGQKLPGVEALQNK